MGTRALAVWWGMEMSPGAVQKGDYRSGCCSALGHRRDSEGLGWCWAHRQGEAGTVSGEEDTVELSSSS